MKKQLCTFIVDNMNIGVDVAQVQEILRRQEITPVPLAPPTIAGLLNLRGQIVMVTDLKRKFSQSNQKTEKNENPIFIILRGEEGPTCFKVDKVGEVLEVDDEFREPLPGQLNETIREYSSGVYSTDHGLVVEMEATHLIEN